MTLHVMNFLKTFRPAAFGIFAAISLTAPIEAQSRTDALRDLLAETPAAMFDGPSAHLEFGDLSIGRQIAALGLLHGYHQDTDFGALARTMPVFWGENFAPILDEFPERVGFELSQIDTVLVAQNLPENLSLFNFDVRVPLTVAPALQQASYSLQQWGDHPIWIRGEEDFSISLRDRTDVFGRRMGASSRIWLDNDLLRHSASTAMMEEMIIHDSLRTTELPGLMALVSLLDGDYLGAGDLATVQFYPGAAISEAAQTVMFADFADGLTDRAVLALLSDTALEALTLQRDLSLYWPTGPGQHISEAGGTSEVISGVTEDARPWVALIVETTRDYDPAVLRNLGLHVMLTEMYRGELQARLN